MATIVNIANNCCLSSILQMITTSEDLVNCFEKNIYKNIFESYFTYKSISIADLIFYYKSLNHSIKIGQNQDAIEALGYILDDSDDKNNFEIKIKQKVYNRNSSEISETITTENMIIVSLKESFQESLDSFFETVEESDDDYYTPKIEYEPDSTPNYLFVAIKRFNHLTLQKIFDEIIFDDVIHYANSNYEIISFIVHLGNKFQGHYINIKFINNEWVLYDDNSSNVIKNKEDLLKIQSVGYVFLLKKIE